MLRVLTRTVSMRRFFWVPKTRVYIDGSENNHNFMLKLLNRPVRASSRRRSWIIINVLRSSVLLSRSGCGWGVRVKGGGVWYWFFAFVCVDSLRPTQKLFIMSGFVPVLLGWPSTEQMIKCLAQGNNAVAAVSLEPATQDHKVQVRFEPEV